MSNILVKLSLMFSAGAFGGLMNGLAVWGCGFFGITRAAGVAIAPQFTELWLYSRLVWGGVWGVVFLLPFLKDRAIPRALVYSIAPSLVQLFVVFPFWLKKGMLGLELGGLTPVFVFLFNFIWGLAAVLWLKAADES